MRWNALEFVNASGSDERARSSFSIRAFGGSMQPALSSGALLDLDPDSRRPAPGDMLAFLSDHGSEVCCHRVIAVDDRGRALTRGDASKMPDGWIEPTRFVGIVASYRLGGRRYTSVPVVRASRYRHVRQRIEHWAVRLPGWVARVLRPPA